MDTTERKTTRYSNVDAVNSAINAVAVSNINNDMHTNGKAWMKRTTVALSFQEGLEAPLQRRNGAAYRPL